MHFVEWKYKLNKNELELKMEIPTHSFGEMKLSKI